MDTLKLKNIVEAALLASGGPLTIAQMQALFSDNGAPERKDIKDSIAALQDDYAERGVEIVEVASGYRVQVREAMSQWLTKLWEERPPRYSRALMETLAIIAYRQPVTRGDIEDIRGVGVTTNIIRTLLERNWIKVIGHRDVPGKPAMFGTTREFLDYFSLKKLDDLPPLAELAELAPIGVQLELGGDQAAAGEGEAGSASGADDGTSTDGEQLASPEGDDSQAVAAESDFDAGENLDDIDDFDDIEGTAGSASDDDEPQSLAAEPDAEIEGDSGIVTGSEDGNEAAADGDDESQQRVSASDDDDGSDDYNEDTDLPPGAVEPLVGLRKPGEAPPEPATIASLDDARAAAEEQGHQPETDFHAVPAEVVPLKTS